MSTTTFPAFIFTNDPDNPRTEAPAQILADITAGAPTATVIEAREEAIRIAIAEAGSRRSNLGGIVLANGRFAIGERVKPVLEAGRAADTQAVAAVL